jgi:HD-GYP domain-containing protein (c-di-GMP phosphodiesterase class II)
VVEQAPNEERVRTAELAATLCLGTDLGMGFPFEHGLQGTVIAIRLAERLGSDQRTAAEAYYASMLLYSGCTGDAEVGTFGGSLTTHFIPAMWGSQREKLVGILRALPDPGRPAPVRAAQLVGRLPRAGRERNPHMEAICDVARMLVGRLGLPDPLPAMFDHLTDRWDGRGELRRAAGEEIPAALRIAHVARDAAVQRMLGGPERTVRVIGDRAGGAFDPAVAGCLIDGADEILALDPDTSVWEEVLAGEPGSTLTLDRGGLDRALAAIGDFADLVSPYLTGHSTGVAELAAGAAQRCGIDADGIDKLRRAAQVHDLGRVAVHPRIWQKPGPLTADEWEQVRLHPYHTGRVLSRSPLLAALAPTASAAHERLDGSGYHRGAVGAELALPVRLLAAADARRAMGEPRPHREALEPERAAAELAAEVEAGRLDGDAVTAVLEAAGQAAPRLERPADLSEREAEVLGLLARGLQTKQIAHTLGIAVKTADRHVQNTYAKIGVSSRAAATVFAMEHGLVAWAELFSPDQARAADPGAATRRGR